MSSSEERKIRAIGKERSQFKGRFVNERELRANVQQEKRASRKFARRGRGDCQGSPRPAELARSICTGRSERARGRGSTVRAVRLDQLAQSRSRWYAGRSGSARSPPPCSRPISPTPRVSQPSSFLVSRNSCFLFFSFLLLPRLSCRAFERALK